jgi:hypothetical protein
MNVVIDQHSNRREQWAYIEYVNLTPYMNEGLVKDKV